jgi:hypothetical protein
MLSKIVYSKKILLILLVGALVVSTIAAFEVGDLVEVEWEGTWYGAAVMETAAGEYFIHYDGYDNSWDEWVGDDRIRYPGGEAKKQADSKIQTAVTVEPLHVREITLWAGGSKYAETSKKGTVWVNSSSVGEIEPESFNVWRGGSKVGEITDSGKIWAGGTIVGYIEEDGDIWDASSKIGEIYGTEIWFGGSSWGSVDVCEDYNDKKIIAALLFFFTE